LDSDVADEMAHVDQLKESEEGSEDNIVLMKHLRKEYPTKVKSDWRAKYKWCNRGNGNETVNLGPKVSVVDSCLTIHTGECFGLLGPNGAGKTTTISMLVGDVVPTSGQARIGGYDIKTDLESTYKLSGYCPQFDALPPLLTGTETLEMFAMIKGATKEEARTMAIQLIEIMGITQYGEKLIKGYSGGTKRKLSIALSLIASPKIVYLDEPSAGVDPASRRFMWSVIEARRGHQTTILTTHSLEEAEAMCSRIGIMVNGRFDCLGSPQHLKHKFSSGYVIELKVNKDQVLDLNKIAPEATLDESFQGHHRYNVAKNTISLSQIFKSLKELSDQGCISDYSVSQSTLEQIFIKFAKKQQEEEK